MTSFIRYQVLLVGCWALWVSVCILGGSRRSWGAERPPFAGVQEGNPAAANRPLQEASAGPSDADLEFFEAKIRPLLAERCFECHGPAADPPSGGLRMDSRASVLTGGDSGPAMVPGRPADSLLIDAINYRGLYEMPPDSKLPADEIALLTQWVERGAAWPTEANAPVRASTQFNLAERKAAHWCWRPISDPPIPHPAGARVPAHPVDAFWRASLLREGLTPVGPAAKEVLIRRLSFDFTGLPPTPDEVDAFVHDTEPDAYERLVDRLLASPRFGERWARHWMDLVRYAETYGHEFDYAIPEAYRYRDYLIRAFNADLPYDDLVREHVAGDLLPQPRLHPQEGYNESVIATGFWFMGEATHAPVDVRSDEAGRIDNQLDVLGKSILGLTIACARCHHHMFDPIPTEDYYGLAGFLQSSRRQMALLDPEQRIANGAARLAEFQVRADAALQSARAQIAQLDSSEAVKLLQAALELAWSRRSAASTHPTDSPAENSPAVAKLAASFRGPRLESPEHPLHFLQQLLQAPGERHGDSGGFAATKLAVAAEFERRRHQAQAARDQSLLFADFEQDLHGWFRTGWAFDEAPTNAWRGGGAAPESLSCAVAGTISSGRLGGPLYGVLRSPTFVLTKKFIHHRLAGKDVQVKLVIDGYTMDSFNSLLFNGVTAGVDSPDRLVWSTQGQDIANYLGHTAHLEYIDHSGGAVCLDEIRFSDESSMPPLPSSFGLRALAADWNDLEGLARYLVRNWREEMQRATPSADAAELWQWGFDSGLASLPGSNGNSASNPGGPRPDAGAESLSDGESLAEILAEKLQWMQSHPIPPPQMVLAICDGTGENEAVFIRGNPKVLGDSAPREMIAALRGQTTWDLQPADGSGRLHLAEALVDPQNPLTARVMANRVWHHLFGRGIVASVDNFGALGDAPTHPELLDHLATEFVRQDWSLKALIRYIVTSQAYQMESAVHPSNGTLDPANRWLHHMPVRRLSAEAIRDSILAVAGTLDSTMYGPSIPVHLTPFMQGRGRPGTDGPLDGNRRRSIYVEVRRNFLAPMMLAFDAPTPFSCVGRRGTSNVPSQALMLMNNPFVWEQAQRWAERLVRERSTAAERIELAYRLSLARSPSAAESTTLQAFLEQQQEELRTLGRDEAPAEVEAWRDLCHILINSKEFYFLQ